MIHCKHLRLSDANKRTYLLTYIGSVCAKVNHAIIAVAIQQYHRHLSACVKSGSTHTPFLTLAIS